MAETRSSHPNSHAVDGLLVSSRFRRDHTAGVESWKRQVDGGFEIDVWVVPGASRDSVDGTHGDALKVRVTAPPDRGKANEAVAALLSAHFGAPVTLLRGSTSRSKTFRIATRS